MDKTDAGRAAAPSWPQAFTELKPRPRRLGAFPGCLTMLGGPLLAFGLWMIAQALLLPHETETVRLSIVTGACAALGGLWLLASRMRKTMAAPRPARVGLAEGRSLTPGATVPIRLHQPGPARMAGLTLSVVCERRFRKEDTAPGSGSATSGDEVETVWSEELLSEADVSLGGRESLTRVVTLTLPRIAKPSGPTLPSGDIAWRLDVARQSAGGAVDYDVFDVRVVLSGDAGGSIQPAPAGGVRPAGGQGSVLEKLGEGFGCLVISLGFMLVGPIFLWLYFSGATTKRGNPVMGLVAGVVFTGLGLVAAWGLVSARGKNKRKYGKGDPRRLP